MKKYEKIIEYINDLVNKKSIISGGKLPTIRELVALFNYNKATVQRAYHELEINHKIYSIPKSGYYLIENKDENNKISENIDFSQVVLDSRLLPYKEFNHAINCAIDLYKSNLFSFSETQGLISLRKVLVNHFSERQIFTTYKKIYITSGSQQALNIISKIPFPSNRTKVLVEQPSYSLLLRLVELNGDELIGIKRGSQGIDLIQLESLFMKKDIKFFYMMPRFHNPLGTSYSEKEKQKIVNLAKKYHVYIVEDDYLADIDMSKKRLPLFYYDTSDMVIYIKSFSKAFMPGMRVSATILPTSLTDEFIKYKKLNDLNTSLLSQGALEVFIDSGMYNKHIEKIRNEYKNKMQFFKQVYGSLETTKIECFIPETGFFIYLKLLENTDTSLLEKRLMNKGIRIITGKEFYINQSTKEKSIRVCISGLSKEEIRDGICKLVYEINILS